MGLRKREFHRYLPAGLGKSRCGICSGSPTDEIHIAGLNQESTGTELVQCPSCKRNVPTDFTVRTFIKPEDDRFKPGILRLCRDCADDPEFGKDVAANLQAQDLHARRMARLMNRLDRGEITQEEYDVKLAELL